MATLEARAGPLERGGSGSGLLAAVAAAEELGGMSLAPTPRCPGGAEFLLDTVAGVVDGGPVAMGAEEEASSVEPVAPPPATKSRTSHHNCFGLPYQDHNYGAPPPATPPQSPPPPPPLSSSPSGGQPALNNGGTPPPGLLLEVGSSPLTNGGSPPADRKEECAPNEESVTRCICGFNQDDEYMICCDQCLVWQHVDCMGLDRSRIPETYLCERCCPRRVDRQRARSLQTRKKHQMARLLSRLESAPEEAPKGAESTAKTRVVRRKRQRSESSPDPPVVHKKAMKEKIEHKRVKLKGMVKRAAGRRLAPSAEEEEAAVGDPWRGGSGGSEGPPSYEQAPANQYSPEVQLLASSLLQTKGVQEPLAEEELVRGGWEGAWQLDECAPPRGRQEGRHRLVTTRAVPAQQPLLEVRGKYLSASQFRLQNPVFQKRLYPCVLFYKGWPDNEDGVCVDARVYGNEARFVRRSCRPSARVRHAFQGGLLRLYLVADRDLAPAEEITIPFDFDYRHCIHRVTCACGQDDCQLHRRKTSTAASPMERKQRGRRRSSSSQMEAEVKEEVNAPQEEDVTSSGPSLDDRPPPVTDASSNEHQEGSPALASPDSAGQEPGTGDDGDLPDSGHSSRRRKMTREERKIDAIMRAFEKMERTEKRRQQALERLQHRGGRPSIDEGRGPEPSDERSNEDTAAVDTDHPGAALPPEEAERLRSLRGPSRKGSKRRRSTLSRRRTRSNSGGPELLLAAAATVGGLECPEGVSFPPPASSSPEEEEEPSPPPPPPELTPPPPCQPPLPKSKRFLMQGWLHEKQHEGAGPSSGEGPPVYVRCTRDTAAGGISAAHLRRHSGSAGTVCNAAGSAKKRWLRQAMFESSEDVPDEGLLSEGAELPVSPLLEDSISPPPADLVTPLKKRRLMRGSLDSVGGLSPATGEAAATLLSFQTPLLLHRYPDEEQQPQHGQGEPSSAGSPPLDDPPTPLDDEGSVDWEEGPSPPAALGPRLLPPLTSGQPSPLELAGRTLEGGRRPTSAPRLPEPLPGPHDEDEGAPKPAEAEVRPPSCWGPEASDSSSSSPRGGKRKVSLSEYRQRMRDTARAPAAAAVPPPPRMANASPDRGCSPLGRPCGGAADARDEDEAWPQRERLSQRLRREFGLVDDDSDTERGTPSGPEDALLPHVYGGYLPPPPLQVLPFGTPLQAPHLDSAPTSLPSSHRPGYFHNS